MIKDFEYLRPKTVEEALSLLARFGEDGKVIAGGQSLLILMRQGLVAPGCLVDIKGISALDYVRLDKETGLKLGALCSHRAIEKSAVVRDKFGILAEMELNLASVQTRNWGTIGGNLCHAEPAGDPAPVLIVLDGRVKIVSSRQERTIPVEEFSVDYFQTVLKPDEMLTEIQVPNPRPRTGTAYSKFTKRAGDMAIVGAAVSITLSPTNGSCSAARIALGAVAPVVVRARKAEEVLVGEKISDSLLEEAGRVAAGETEPGSDIHASAEYRKELVKVLVAEVAGEAVARARKARSGQGGKS